MDSIELRFHPGERTSLSLIEPTISVSPNAYITKKGNICEVSLYYPHNTAIGCGWFLWPMAPCLGYHEHDIEFVRIYYVREKPTSVFFSAHSPNQGSWIKWEDCEHGEDGALVVYVSRNSHANYHCSGIHWRMFGFANDVCSEKGQHLRMAFASMVPSYDFTFSNGISLYKDIRPNVPHPKTVLTKWQKFILPLLKIFPCLA